MSPTLSTAAAAPEYRLAGSLRRGHDEFRALRGALRPALHDRLLPRVEAHTFLAVSVHVAEQTLLPATETMPGHRHGDRHVDPHHADLNSPSELACDVPVAGVARHAVAKFVRVHEVHSRSEILHAHATKYGSEDFYPVDAHLRGHPIEQSAAEPEAALVTGDGEGAARFGVHPAVDGELRTTRHALVDIRTDPLERLACDDRPHFCAGVHAVADLELSGALGELRHDLVRNISH